MKLEFIKQSQKKMPELMLGLFLVFCITVSSQKVTTIEGTVLDNSHNNDTIIFRPGMISYAYYEKPTFFSKIVNTHFKINEKFSYPQMFYIAWRSDKMHPWKNGAFFIDESTKQIKIDSNYTTSGVEGETFSEYRNRFIPFIIKNENIDLDAYIYNNGSEFDSKLMNYISKNSDSYVGLWFLINIDFHRGNYLQYYNVEAPLKTNFLLKSHGYDC